MHCLRFSPLCDPKRFRGMRRLLLSLPRQMMAAKFSRGLLLTGAFILAQAGARAQVAPALHLPPDVGIFGTYTIAQPTVGGAFNTVSGVTTGAYLRPQSLLGVELRGVFLRWTGYDHEYAALIGPRASFYLGRFSVYGALEVGPGRAWRVVETNQNGSVKLAAHSAGFEWSLIGGADLNLKHHWNLRVGELSFSNIYASGQVRKPLNYSFGLVYRLR